MTSAVVIRSRAKVSDVRKWVIALGVLTAGNMTRVEAEMKLRAYVPLLQERFPPGAFTQASLEAVASQCRFFPAYGDVATYLAAWWFEHRPPLPQLPPPPREPERPPPTPEEIAYVHERVREVVASLHAAPLYADQPPQRLDDEATTTFIRPRYLTPEQLDQISPLPNGRKRAHAVDQAAATSAASVAPDPASETVAPTWDGDDAA